MVCKHLKNLENELIHGNIKIIYCGQAWSNNCREWVYFDCYLDRQSIEKRFNFPDFIEYHEHRGTHDGQEAGFFCSKCKDGIMGHHKAYSQNKFVFK